MDSGDFKFAVVTVSIVILIVGFIICGVMFFSASSDDKKWNDGCCECGSHWVYEQAVGHQYSTTYIYKCPTCGNRIEISSTRGSEDNNG